ncbi:MAG: transcriptional regulator NrdR [Proteobacteria bacterium]|nr:transcriptional regulator NrdR [Pseudomonadota bacterium]MBU1583514.1 transcriptional regulator NrdR [Pseudomonadota bacterium]MBU2454313.1 transcriptional regulator NrdR [Pseudomonadota bacterium]MBU2629593.1 transcriptional regulator NrdR [Pseudomonadota bacterium]
MNCPFCGKPNTKVVDSRPGKIEFEVRRRRECLVCTQRFTTYERVEQIPITIVKKDSRREEFNREKVLTGIKKACEKRAISIHQIEETVDNIERDLRESNEQEIPSKVVGEKIIEALKQIDDVAYVRFASVYREFKDVADFIQELKGLLPKDCLPIEFEAFSDKADDRS